MGHIVCRFDSLLGDMSSSFFSLEGVLYATPDVSLRERRIRVKMQPISHDEGEEATTGLTEIDEEGFYSGGG